MLMSKLSGKNKNFIYFVEGETEESIIKALRFFGSVRKLNLWEFDLNKVISNFSQKTDIFFIVFDTDTICNIGRFNQNIKLLDNKGYQYYLLPQNKNLEDELIYCCHKINSHQELYKHFNASSNSEYKNVINKLRPENLNKKLEDAHFQEPLLWSRTILQIIKHNSQPLQRPILKKP